MIKGVFVTATGTGVGKTWVTRGLSRAFRRRGVDLIALKPIETGCTPEPLDAIAIARACGRPELAHHAGFYRTEPPLSPYSASIEGEIAVDVDGVLTVIEALAKTSELTIVEGAGGVLVPIDERHSMADLAVRLAIPALLVARNELGVLSYVLTALESLFVRQIDLCGVVLVDTASPDPSVASNDTILGEHVERVFRFSHCDDDDDALADAAEACGLVDALR